MYSDCFVYLISDRSVDGSGWCRRTVRIPRAEWHGRTGAIERAAKELNLHAGEHDFAIQLPTDYAAPEQPLLGFVTARVSVEVTVANVQALRRLR